MFPILLAAGLVFLAGGWLFAWKVELFLNIPPDRVWDAGDAGRADVHGSAARALSAWAFSSGSGSFSRTLSISAPLFRIALLFGLIFGVSTRCCG
jgi:hypothetical protein